METVIPVFPCGSLDETLDFYRALGFAVTHEQTTPYVYGAVRRGEVEIHFARIKGQGNKPGGCLVMVEAVNAYHQAFAEGLRAQYGRIPLTNFPRITRLRPFHTRFQLFDPFSNVLVFINRDEPDIEYDAYEAASPLAGSLDNAAFLRDTYANDEAAVRVLDKALVRYETADPLDRARALAARAELAVALNDMERFQAIQRELPQIPLTDEERETYREELQAAQTLAQWLTQKEI